MIGLRHDKYAQVTVNFKYPQVDVMPIGPGDSTKKRKKSMINKNAKPDPTQEIKFLIKKPKFDSMSNCGKSNM